MLTMKSKSLAFSLLFCATLAQAQQDQKQDEWSDEESMTEDWEEDESAVEFNGFIESRVGTRLQTDQHQKSNSIAEIRLKTELEKEFEHFSIKLNSNFVADRVTGSESLNLKHGSGFMDLRELSVSFSPTENIDIKLGRQVLTWGTGDLVFINDLFSKDWRSFFNGRDTQYLKAPTDAIKTSFFLPHINLDVVYMPQFNSDRFIEGKRLSYLNSGSTDNYLRAQRPDNWFKDDEIALRAYQSFGSVEAAAYYYHGFSKSPGAVDLTTGKAIFPELSVYGLSVRTPFAKGILNAEVGYHDMTIQNDTNIAYSKDDEMRYLLGYEQELAKELTGAFQYSVETKKNKTDRHITTLRLTKLLDQQKLVLSSFVFYSPKEKDGYLRLNAGYKVNDDLKVEVGSNVFFGSDKDAFFTQFKNNNNVFGAIRYSF